MTYFIRKFFFLHLCVLICAPAFANDLPQDHKESHIFSKQWDGFYAGSFIGYSFGQAKTKDIGFGSATIDMDGLSGGFIMGVSHQSNRFVYGLEADLGIHEFKGAGGGAVTQQSVDHLWSGHLRGRLGFTHDAFLPYLSAGLSYGAVHNHRTTFFADGDIDHLLGWTIGAGLDYQTQSGLIGRIEYLYEHLPDASYAYTAAGRTVKSDFVTHMIRLAMLKKAKSPSHAYPVKGERSTSHPVRWNGFYAGASIGGGFGQSDLQQKQGVLNGGKASMDLDGYAYGGFMGWQKQFGHFVSGIEADLSLTKIDGEVAQASTIGIQSDLFWLASAKVRLGYAYGDFLPFISAGYALGQVESRQIGTLGPAPDPLKSGFTLGGGLDYALNERLSTRISYDYIDLGTTKIAPGGLLTSFSPDLHLIRGGIALKLGQ